MANVTVIWGVFSWEKNHDKFRQCPNLAKNMDKETKRPPTEFLVYISIDPSPKEKFGEQERQTVPTQTIVCSHHIRSYTLKSRDGKLLLRAEFTVRGHESKHGHGTDTAALCLWPPGEQTVLEGAGRRGEEKK